MAYIRVDGPDDDGKFTAKLVENDVPAPGVVTTVASKADLERLMQEWGVDEVRGAGLLSIHDGEP